MKVVYDTCLYIDLLRSGQRLELFSDRAHIRYLSPIVMMELLAGAQTPQQNKIVDRLLRPYSQAARIVQIGANLFHKAGECVAQLSRTGFSLGRGFSNDVLIAVSAASIGATLFTNNKKDFLKISRFIPVNIHYV